MNITVPVVPKIEKFFDDNPNKDIYVIAGGRGKGATWGIGYRLILSALKEPNFILCSREIKDTVDVSSKRTIERLITGMGLKDYFKFYRQETVRKETKTVAEARFIYTGLSKMTEDNVQGIEGVSKVWLGEAHTMEFSTWQKLEPTIRDEGSEIYMDYNIQDVNVPVHLLFTENPNEWPFEGKKSMNNLAYLFLSAYENPYLPRKLAQMRENNKKQYSLQDWEWIWLGKLKSSEDRYLADERRVANAFRRELEYDYSEYPVVGADIAHMGGDEIVFYMRLGNKIIKRFIEKKLTVPDTVRKLREFCEHDTGVSINIDNGHVGAAVADAMVEAGYTVNRINFGSTKKKVYDPNHCYETASDMAFYFVEKCLDKADLGEDDYILMQQIVQRRWSFRNDGKAVRQIESKNDFKEHVIHLDGNKSPDRADALFLCFYLDNYGHHKQRMHDMVGG